MKRDSRNRVGGSGGFRCGVYPGANVSTYRTRECHNPLLAPGVCLCRERCAEIMLALRCEATDADGNRCGDYKGHIPRKEHSLLVATTFQIAEAARAASSPKEPR